MRPGVNGCRRLATLIVLAATTLAACQIALKAHAASFEAGGFVFSDELGGFQLLSAMGKGSEADPIIVVESVATLGAAILVIRQAPAASGDLGFRARIRVHVKKIVINASGRAWTGYDLELQAERGKPSGYMDGLSFDQLRPAERIALGADRFSQNVWSAEPYDRIYFRGGSVDPGARVSLEFTITDVSPKPTFFLRQQPIILTAGLENVPRRLHRGRLASAEKYCHGGAKWINQTSRSSAR